MRRMPVTDAFFLLNETRETPMHVGGVNLYTLPRGVNEQDFLQELGDLLRQECEMRRPFGERLRMGPLGAAGPVGWEHDDQLDLDYHVRHSALPGPGRYRELFSLVSRLHSTLLDRSRPLWEMHLIEGLQKRQFATYIKAHHCAIDGVGAMHLTNSMLSENPRERSAVSPFSRQAAEAYKARLTAGGRRGGRHEAPAHADLQAVAELLKQQFDAAGNVAGALRRYTDVWFGRGGALSVPWRQVPRTHFNTTVSGARLEGIYPASIPFHGFAVNITLVSYAKSLDFGIVACRRSVPHVQRLIDYIEEALVELEDAAGLSAAAPKPARRVSRR